MNSVVHFEMPAEDQKRMADFYTKVFGWKTIAIWSAGFCRRGDDPGGD